MSACHIIINIGQKSVIDLKNTVAPALIVIP